MTNTEIDIFERKTPFKAVFAMIIPAIISQIVTVVYNMADTFFIGRTGDPNQIAAASLCMPLFVFLTGLANLFGIGGSGAMSRSLGGGDRVRASGVSSFCIYTAAVISLIYGIIIYIIKPILLPIVGANSATFSFASSYLFWTVCIGSLPTVLSALLSHLVRAEGDSKRAGFGIMLGAILNMILDPILISGLHMEIAGAALATMISNVVSLIYLIRVILSKKTRLLLALILAHIPLSSIYLWM